MSQSEYLVSKARRDYKANSVHLSPMGTMEQLADAGELEFFVNRTGQTLFRKRPKYDVVLHYPNWKGLSIPERMKLADDFGDELHRKYKSGATRKVRGKTVKYGS